MLETNWGLATGYLAVRCVANADPEFLAAASIAREAGLSLPSTHKIMRSLCRQGLLTSVRGKGYKLARAKSSISVLEILEALSGPSLFPACCPLKAPECPTRNSCPLWSACSGAQEKLKSELAELKLDRLPMDDAGKPACLNVRRTSWPKV